MSTPQIPDPQLCVMALQRAAEILGGTHALAEMLKAPHSSVVYWLNGNGPVPARIFFEAVEIIEGAMLTALHSNPNAEKEGPPQGTDQPGNQLR